MARRKALRSPRLERKTRRRKTRRATLAAILALLLIGATIYAFSRKEFRIASVEVSGSLRVPEASVRADIERVLSGTYLGFVPKSHALLYPRSAIKKELLSHFPELSRVSLSLRNLAALRVTLFERETAALWCVDRSECFLMDETGFAFERAENAANRSYYRIESAATTTPLGRAVISSTRLSTLIAFLKKLESIGLEPEKAILKNVEEVEVVLSGSQVLLLRESDFEQSLKRLQILLAQDNLLPKGGEGPVVRSIDLRYGNKIYFTPR